VGWSAQCQNDSRLTSDGTAADGVEQETLRRAVGASARVLHDVRGAAEVAGPAQSAPGGACRTRTDPSHWSPVAVWAAGLSYRLAAPVAPSLAWLA